MEKKFFFLADLVILFLLCGCSLVGVNDDVVKKDIRTRFENEYQKVDDIEIIKKNKNEKAEDIYVSFEIITDELVQKEYYCLNYNYYDNRRWGNYDSRLAQNTQF